MPEAEQAVIATLDIDVSIDIDQFAQDIDFNEDKDLAHAIDLDFWMNDM